jgi:long-subunit acyl-CoA synthetase (AMP-forming)
VHAPDSSKQSEKLRLGEYEFTTYSEYREQVLQLGAGLVSFAKLRRGDRILFYAETRREWMLACLAAFSQSLTVVTVYTSLGEDGLAHSLAQTRAKLVLTDQSLLGNLSRAVAASPTKTRSCKHVAYIPMSALVPDPEAEQALTLAVGSFRGSKWKVENTDNISERGRLHPAPPRPRSDGCTGCHRTSRRTACLPWARPA